MLDVIYSLTSHESPQCVDDLIENIRQTNFDLSYLIINNTTISNLISTDTNHIIIFSNKRNKVGADIFKSHIDNYSHVKDVYKFKLFIPLSSNCYFIKKMTKQTIERLCKHKHKELTHHSYTDHHINLSHWFYPNINENVDFVSFCKQIDVEITNYQHEGLALSQENMELLSKYSYDKQCSFPLEEVLFASVIRSYCGYIPETICKNFWHRYNFTPTFADILYQIYFNDKIYVVKRVNRVIDDKLRIKIRQKLKNML